jgi:1,4-alpha-glucan branching enzyme
VTISAREGLEQFVFTSSDTERTLRVRAPRASSVELAGDVTNWEPLALTSTGDGWWVITISVPSGVHQVSFRLDHGRWLSPPGTLAVTDEFGGAAGMWEVP